MLKYTGINHLAMVTNDMDKTIRFWRDLLGMRLIAGLGGKRFRHYFFEISETDAIAFFEWPEVENADIKDHGVPVKGPFMFDHVSIGVETDADLVRLKNRLESCDFWVSEIIDHGFIHSIYLFDPNNIPIEFSAPVSETDIRRSPRMKDSRPTKAASEGPEPINDYWVCGPYGETDENIYPGEGVVLREDDE